MPCVASQSTRRSLPIAREFVSESVRTYKLGDLLALLVDVLLQLVDMSDSRHTLVLNLSVLLFPIEVLDK